MKVGLTVLIRMARALMQWTYEEKTVYPTFVTTTEQKTLVGTNLKLWKITEQHVFQNGCFVPLKLFKQAAQSYQIKKSWFGRSDTIARNFTPCHVTLHLVVKESALNIEYNR